MKEYYADKKLIKMKEYITKKIVIERKRKGITQAELANMANMSTTTLSHAESYNHFSNMKVILKLLNALDLEIKIGHKGDDNVE